MDEPLIETCLKLSGWEKAPLLSEQYGRDTEQSRDSHRNEPGEGMKVPLVSYRS
jgi:hypothetical protein